MPRIRLQRCLTTTAKDRWSGLGRDLLPVDEVAQLERREALNEDVGLVTGRRMDWKSGKGTLGKMVKRLLEGSSQKEFRVSEGKTPEAVREKKPDNQNDMS